jgi:hypothetical protein
MNKLTITVFVVALLPFVSFVAVMPMTSNADSPPSTSSTEPCFVFTLNTTVISPHHCNANANDIETVFRALSVAPCSIQFTLNKKDVGKLQLCPKSANDVSVTWGMSAAGAVGIIACAWTHEGVVLSIPCSVPSSPSADGFTFSYATILRVEWTSGNSVIGKVKAPPGTNNLELISI